MCSRHVRILICCACALFALCLFFDPSAAKSGTQDAPDSLHRPQRVISFEHTNQELTLRCDAGLLLVRAYADNIVQIRYYPGTAKKTLTQSGIIAKPAGPRYRVDSTLTAIRLATAQLIVNIERKTAQITFLDQKQNVLLSSKKVELKSAQTTGEGTYQLHAEFVAPEDEAYYGLGQDPNELIDQRGQTVHLGPSRPATEAKVSEIPFLVTNRNYGLLFDNLSKVTVAPGKAGVTTWDADSAEALSYFVIYGNEMEDIYKGYRVLTGKSPWPPVPVAVSLPSGEGNEPLGPFTPGHLPEQGKFPVN